MRLSQSGSRTALSDTTIMLLRDRQYRDVRLAMCVNDSVQALAIPFDDSGL